MPTAGLKILLVDDEVKLLNSIARRLRLQGFDPLTASSGRSALALAEKHHIDMAIVDFKMPDMDGLVTITKLKEKHPDLRTVLLTGHGNEKIKQATRTLHADYFVKDQMESFWDFIKKSNRSGNTIVITPPSVNPSIENAGEDSFSPGSIEILPGIKSTKDRTELFKTQVGKNESLQAERLRMIGETPVMQGLRRDIERLAALDCPVIIRGETGTGKEMAARIIHNSSARKNSRFVAINCGCFSNDLLIEELFANNSNAAESGTNQTGGTILLDQIEEMSPKMQLSMLKIIDGKKKSLQDGANISSFNVRILTASRYNLMELVKEGKFREELYYRLNMFELFIPPLRERRDDIPPLCSYFLHTIAKEFEKKIEHISDKVMSTFMAYDFPGNVRELEHIIERAIILADGNTIKLKHLPERFHVPASPALDPTRTFMTLAEKEKKYILEVLEAAGGNKSKTSEILGISRAALWRKLKQYKKDNNPTISEHKERQVN